MTSPVHIAAAASLVNPIDHMRVYVDEVPTYFSFYNAVDALIMMDPGLHNVIIVATDKSGNDVSTSFQLNVTGTKGPVTVSDLQNTPGWEGCSKLFPPGHPRAGQVCASGDTGAVASMTQNQAMPSLSGSSAKFTLGGTIGYSLELWTRYFGGSTTTSHFTYDLYFMIDNPDASQGLEFDVNQAFGNRRWVFGTECNFKGSGKWDVWDGTANQWNPTSLDCNPFTPNVWHHLVWQFERVGEQVHYISISIDETTYPLDLYYRNQPNWTMEDIDVAFQMDGDYRQTPYTVWLDKVSLITW